MKKITLESGLTLNVEDNVLNNMELLDTLVDMDGGDWRAMSQAFRMILPPEEKKKLWDKLRNDHGVVQIDKAAEAFNEILRILGDQGKN